MQRNGRIHRCFIIIQWHWACSHSEDKEPVVISSSRAPAFNSFSALPSSQKPLNKFRKIFNIQIYMPPSQVKKVVIWSKAWQRHVFVSKNSHNRNISLAHQSTQLWPCTGCSLVTWHSHLPVRPETFLVYRTQVLRHLRDRCDGDFSALIQGGATDPSAEICLQHGPRWAPTNLLEDESSLPFPQHLEKFWILLERLCGSERWSAIQFLLRAVCRFKRCFH